MTRTMKRLVDEVMLAPIGQGWAVVTRSSWDHINEQLSTIASIVNCSTWGEYRELRITDEELVELVWQEADIDPDDEPPNDAPFSVQLSYEDYDRDAWLQRATTDLFESIEDDSFPWDRVSFADMWTTVDDEHLDVVVQALEQRGFQVTRVVE